MRITTNMIMRNYQNNLYSTLGGLDSSRKQVETGMRISNAYEDPSAAARAAILERRYARNSEYLTNIENTQDWLTEQENVVYEIGKLASTVADNYSVAAVTDTAGDIGRETYAEGLRNIQKSMVQTLNTKYSNSFVMGGNGGTQEAPFELTEDGRLLYRGVDVESTDSDDQAILEQLARETSYVDVGFGLEFDGTGNIVSSSAFDAALPGINVVGYGQTDDGTSKNLILLAGQMAEVLEADEFDRDAYSKLWDQFRESSTPAQDTLTELGTKSELLETTQSRLENEKINIQAQYNNEVGIEPAEAITNMAWAQYAYSSALKVGTSIIGPSLLDFLS